jgi:hypothetical protein
VCSAAAIAAGNVMAIRWRRIALVVCVGTGLFVAIVAARKLRSGPDGAAAAAAAAADNTWASGDEESVRKMFRTELDRLPEADGPGRARVFIRFGIIDTNPDGQAALFAQACVVDPNVCDRDRLQQAAEREVRARKVPPGNHLPLYFVGHPRLAGPR